MDPKVSWDPGHPSIHLKKFHAPSLYPPYLSAPGCLKMAELSWISLFIHLRAPQKRDIHTPHPQCDRHHSSTHIIHPFFSSTPDSREAGREGETLRKYTLPSGARSSAVCWAFAPCICIIIRKGRARHCSRNRRSQGFLAPSRLRQWRRASARHRRNPCSIAIALHLELKQEQERKRKQKQNRIEQKQNGRARVWSEDFGAMQLQQFHTTRKV